MPTFVPALGALFQGFVVALFIFLDQALQADVTANLLAQVVALKQQKQPGYPAIAVAEGMDAEKIEIKSCQGNNGREPALTKAMVPSLDQSPHVRLGLCRRNGLKAHPLSTVRIFLNNVAILFFVFSSIPDLTSGLSMQSLRRLF